MKFFTYMLVGGLVFGIFRARRTVQGCKSDRERNFLVRTGATWALFIFFVLCALLILPTRGRILVILPAFFVFVTGARAWANARERLRREQNAKVDFEKMKRIN